MGREWELGIGIRGNSYRGRLGKNVGQMRKRGRRKGSFRWKEIANWNWIKQTGREV
jgi:hypothetical protein